MHRAVLLALALAAAPVVARAQGAAKKPAATKKAASTKTAPPATATKAPARPPGKTTLSGIYTLDEARAGKEMYAGLCAGCHTAASHAGPTFKKKWTGRPLSELFTYMRTLMPKNDPGTLADEDYGVLLAYMLQMNQMPAGRAPLSTDTTELAKIRIDTAVVVRKP
jgi:S-disulfanyl-L-cysteine oxidoreductase SoxD